MIIQHTQQDININLPSNYKNIGIRLSGGPDSAIIAYILAKYIAEYRNDLNLIAITLNIKNKGFQIPHAKLVIEFIEKTFNIKFKNHYISDEIEDQNDSGKLQLNYVTQLINYRVIDCYYTGLTKNPPDDEMKKFAVNIFEFKNPENTALHRSHTDIKKTVQGKAHMPLINIDKRGVYELYKKFDLLDNLFPLTRSCENFSVNLFEYCGNKCWQCCERFWGFGRFK